MIFTHLRLIALLSLQAFIFSAFSVVASHPALMTDRDFYRYGVPRGSSSSRGARGASRGIPLSPLPMEDFSYPQETHRAPNGISSFYDSEYNLNYGDNLSSYLDLPPEREMDYVQEPFQRDNFMRDYNEFHDNFRNDNNHNDYELPHNLTDRLDNNFCDVNYNVNSGRNVSGYNAAAYNGNNFNNFRNHNSFSNFDIRQNSGGNDNLIHEFNTDLFDNNNFQDSQPVTMNNLRSMISEILSPPQPDSQINNFAHGTFSNSSRLPPPRSEPASNFRAVAGGTGAARSHARDSLPMKPAGLTNSEWRAMCSTLNQTRAARGAVPPGHSLNYPCSAPPLQDDAEEYVDENESDSSSSGSSS